jgi:hypothetical protein
MYGGLPLALAASAVALRRSRSLVIALSFFGLALIECVFVLVFTSLGIWASGAQFLPGLFGF